MIDFQNITKAFGAQEVLRDVSFRVNPGEHVGITGPNGAGKSTIFKLLTGEITPDDGAISVPRDTRIGHLHQQLNAHAQDTTLLAYAENAVGELNDIENEIHRLEARLAEAGEGGATSKDIMQLGELQSRFEHLGGYEIQSRAEATLSGLGFSTAAFQRQFTEFSGGWQMRAELARVLTANPDILLLDEPTNYLDVGAVEWLRSYLRDFAGIMLLISHDRYLLNSLTHVTLEVANGMADRYAGNYNHYVEARQARREQMEAARKNQERKREQIERFVQRFRYQANKASQVQSRLKMLDKMEEIQVPGNAARPADIKLPKPQRSGHEVIRIEQGGVTYDGDNWVFRNLDFRLERGMKAAIVGPNGMGKTTLLRVLAGKLTLQEGKRQLGTKVKPGYQAQEFTDIMDTAKNVFSTVRDGAAEATDGEARSLLGSFGFSGDSVEKTVEVLSGGEKVRLALARMLLRAPNFILLDEPTTHLDIPTRQALENTLMNYKGTLCFVSHDIEFIRHVADTIYAIGPEGLTKYFGGYDYYRRKLAEAEEFEGSWPADRNSGLAKKGAGGTGNRQAQRRHKALSRKEISRKIKPLQRRAKSAEAQVQALQTEQKELLAKIQADPMRSDMADINRRLAEIQKGIDEATVAWEEAELAIEELQ
ncbi:MAG: ABC-F family ATP-binding cassette domain-containing protein [Lentisphaeria bacterium]